MFYGICVAGAVSSERVTSGPVTWSPVTLLAGVILFCPGVLSAEPASRVQTYDVSALVERPAHLPPPRFGPQPVDGEPKAPPVPAQETERKEEERRQVLLARIRAEVCPQCWRGDGRLEAREGELVVHAPPAVHDELGRFLKELHAELDWAVLIEGKFVSFSEEDFETFQPELTEKFRRLPPEDRVSPRPRLTAAEVERLSQLTVPLTVPAANVPMLTLRNQQRGHVMVCTQQAYIADVRVVERDGKRVPEPVIGISAVGVAIEVEPRVRADRQSLRLDLGFRYADQIEPVAEILVRDIEELKGVNLSIEAPEFSMVAFETSLEAVSGEWFIAGTFPSFVRAKDPDTGRTHGPDDGWTTLVLIRATVLERKAE